MSITHTKLLPTYPHNYLALTLLETLGIIEPLQSQINTVEIFIAQALQGNKSMHCPRYHCAERKHI